MAKKKSGKKEKKRRELVELNSYDVYQQADDALVVIPSSDTPEDEDANLVATVEAESELEAIRVVRKAHKWTRKLAVANPDHDPDVSDEVREEAERKTNARLGITPRPSKKKGAKKKSAAKKSGAKKKTATRKKKTARRK